MKKRSQGKQAPPDNKSLVLKYLRSGKSLEDAAACAGIDYETALEALNKEPETLAVTTNIAHAIADKALQDSYRIISELAEAGEDEETRLGAAKELRKFAFDLMRIKTPQETKTHIMIEQKDLWE